MMIFHKFPTEKAAHEYARRIKEETKLDAIVYMNVDLARKEVHYPFEMLAPVVLVDRGHIFDEAWAQSLVIDFDGDFAETRYD